MTTSLVQEALSYAARGWRVFPLHGIVNGRCTCGRRDCSSSGKHPLVRHGVKEASTEASMIQEWWSRWPLANIGLATGKTSGIVAIDIDLPRALPSLDEFVHKLPRTLTGCTGGGGMHLIYRGNCVDLRAQPHKCPESGLLSASTCAAMAATSWLRPAPIAAAGPTSGWIRT